MGARAHGRRHEGRAIRKARREWDTLTRGFVAMQRAFEQFAVAIQESMAQVSAFVKELETIPEQNVPALAAPAGAVSRSEEGVPYPTRSEGEAVRTAASVPEKVDAAAARMGLTLLPWQRSLAIRVLELEPGQPVVPHEGGRRAGRTTVTRVVEGVLRGAEHGMAYIDEVPDSPR